MRKTIEHKTTFTNHTTGETESVTKEINIRTGDSEEFFSIFSRYISVLFEIKCVTDIHLLIKFCQLAEYNTGAVVLSTARRREIGEQLGINNPNLSRSITRLKQKGVIDGSQGTFYLNPIIAWKGDSKSRKDRVKKMQANFKINFTSTAFNDEQADTGDQLDSEEMGAELYPEEIGADGVQS